MNILFIGNSFTWFNDIPGMFNDLAKLNGKDVSVYNVLKSGHRLHEYVNEGGEWTYRIQTMKRSRNYDYVILQDYSNQPVARTDDFRSAVKDLTEMFKPVADNIVLYETWGYSKGCTILDTLKLNDIEFYEQMIENQRKAAKDFGLILSPVGENFYKLYKKGELDLYHPDLRHPSYIGSMVSLLTHYKTVFGELPQRTDCIKLPKEIIDKIIAEI